MTPLIPAPLLWHAPGPVSTLVADGDRAASTGTVGGATTFPLVYYGQKYYD